MKVYMFVVILSINKMYRQKKLVILVAVDRSSKKALPKRRLSLIICKLISFRGLSVTVSPRRYRCGRFAANWWGTAKVFLPLACELHQLLECPAAGNSYSMLKIQNNPFSSSADVFFHWACKGVGEIRSKVDIFQAEIISTMSLTIFPAPEGLETHALSLKTNVMTLQLAESMPLSTAAGSGTLENDATRIYYCFTPGEVILWKRGRCWGVKLENLVL